MRTVIGDGEKKRMVEDSLLSPKLDNSIGRHLKANLFSDKSKRNKWHPVPHSSVKISQDIDNLFSYSSFFNRKYFVFFLLSVRKAGENKKSLYCLSNLIKLIFIYIILFVSKTNTSSLE